MLNIDRFADALFNELKLPDNATYYIAFSGGVDSTVLLHLMSSLQKDQAFKLVALHVDHNLQADSHRWSAHCKNVCADLGVDFKSTKVNLDSSSESTARSARYQWMREQIEPGSILMTAHHQQDRAETFLFNLMRGAGSAGLSSLRPLRPFYNARLARPLLEFSKNDVLQYAQDQNLQWIEDPSNEDTSYSRNDIRKNVVPTLVDYRQDAVRNVARAAANLERENALMREVAIADLVEVREHPKHPQDQSHALCTDDLVFFSPARQANLIRFWLYSLELHTPSQRFLEKILAAIDTPPSATAVLQEEGFQFRFYKGFMYVMPAGHMETAFDCIEWQNPDHPLGLFSDKIHVDAKPKLHELVNLHKPDALRLSAREHVLNPQALQGHSLNLKKWMQDAGVPPWRRQSLPILNYVKKNTTVVLTPVDQSLHNDWVSLHCAV